MITIPRQSKTIPGTPPRIVVIGDSLSDISGPEGSWTGYIAPQLAIAAKNAGITAPIPSSPFVKISVPSNLTPTAPHVWLNIAVSGTNCLNMESANIVSQVIALKPDILLWCLFGRNCVFGRLNSGWNSGAPFTSGTPSRNTCIANHLDIVTRCKAAFPNLQILMTSPVCEGEQSPDGANANDSEMDAQDTIQANAAAAVGAQYFSIRAPFFAQEAIVNPTKLNVGVMTVDGVHLWHTTSPAPAVNGQLWAANQLFPLFNIGQ